MEILENIQDFFCNLTHAQLIDILLAILIIIVFKLLSGLLARFVTAILKLFIRERDDYKKYWAYKASKTFFILLGVYVALYILKLPENIFLGISKIFKICTILLISNALVALFNNSSNFFKQIREKYHFRGNEIASNFLSKIIAVFVYIVAGFIIISELGYDLGGLATGLGISSVVVAFATQDLIKSLFGGFSIIYDKTFEIGDYIKTKDFEGTVEDITIKTTRIRDLNDRIIAIPNYLLTESYIINISKIKNRRYYSKLTLELDTPLDKINTFTNSIKELLTQNELIVDSSIKVYFGAISDNGIDIFIDCNSSISNLSPFIELKEQINYEILSLSKSQSIGLAYPSQTLYLKKDN